jgi:hypothetical protein
MDIMGFDWVYAAGVLIALAVVWFVVRTIFKLTMRIFACGCAVIGGLVLAGVVLLNWEQIAGMLR